MGSWVGSTQNIDASAAATAVPSARGKKGTKAADCRQQKKDASASSSPSHGRPSSGRPQSSKGKAHAPAVSSRDKGSRSRSACASSRASSSYDLFCVICHRGSLAGGHYTAFLRCGPQWFLCDDACLMAVAVADVAACQPYMLFYSRTNQSSAPSLHAS